MQTNQNYNSLVLLLSNHFTSYHLNGAEVRTRRVACRLAEVSPFEHHRLEPLWVVHMTCLINKTSRLMTIYRFVGCHGRYDAGVHAHEISSLTLRIAQHWVNTVSHIHCLD